MFGRLKERIAGNKRVSGLSRAMSIVDEFMVPGSTVKALDHGYGQAYATIRQEYIEGKFDENEMKAEVHFDFLFRFYLPVEKRQYFQEQKDFWRDL